MSGERGAPEVSANVFGKRFVRVLKFSSSDQGQKLAVVWSGHCPRAGYGVREPQASSRDALVRRTFCSRRGLGLDVEIEHQSTKSKSHDSSLVEWMWLEFQSVRRSVLGESCQEGFWNLHWKYITLLTVPPRLRLMIGKARPVATSHRHDDYAV